MPDGSPTIDGKIGCGLLILPSHVESIAFTAPGLRLQSFCQLIFGAPFRILTLPIFHALHV